MSLSENSYTVIRSIFNDIPGSHRYCTAEAAQFIRKKLKNDPTPAIHLIGSGDYHYVTLFLLEKLEKPFTLVLFDNHPDDQSGAFSDELLSCGGWVAKARELPMCKEVLWNPAELPEDRNIYISVDLDVLSPEYATTNWNQGDMTLKDLLNRLSTLKNNNMVEGVDICGALPEDPEINADTVSGIIDVFCVNLQQN